jgi:DNA-binding response OmpR family regulator
MTKILLVEDDKSLREIYGVRLLAEGYDIVSAGDGEEALAMAIKERPNLIISDVMMPKISGFDMLDILRSTTETRGIKVIMMTALSSEDQRRRGESLGADRYLVKSQVGIEDVVKTVHDVLNDGHLTPEQRTADKTAPQENQKNIQPQENQSASTPSPIPELQQMSADPRTAQPLTQPQRPFVQQQPQAVAQQIPQNQPLESMPRPTAPFSTDRPSNLGDRVIKPISNVQNQETNERAFAEKMDNILNNPSISTQPQQPSPIQQPNLTPVSNLSEQPVRPINNPTEPQQARPMPQQISPSPQQSVQSQQVSPLQQISTPQPPQPTPQPQSQTQPQQQTQQNQTGPFFGAQ